MNLRSARFVVSTFCVLLIAANLSSRASGSSQGKDVTITKDDEIASIDCNGSTVTVGGDDNKLTLKGECSKLIVSGDDNVINAAAVKEIEVSGSDNVLTVETVAKISTTGDDNTIAWKSGVAGKAPEISLKGQDNKVAQAGK